MNQDNHQKLTTITTDELRDDQLDKVTGGLVVIAIIPILIGMLHDAPVKSTSGK